MSKPKEKQYGIADRAWQCVIGCDPHMPCAPRCWARKTMARIVECQKPENPERAEFYQIALTPDGKQWSGKTYLDEAHLLDPLKWRKPAVIATGFHGDWGRLSPEDMATILAVMSECPEHTFLALTKQPREIANLLAWDFLEDEIDAAGSRLGWCHANASGRIPFCNVSIGCSVMNQAEADRQREPMAQIAAMGWATHVWYEPAIGPVDWRGWEFLRGVIAGFESGKNSRPGHPAWARTTRDWCVVNSVPFNFKQWGDWSPECADFHRVSAHRWSHETFAWGKDGHKYNPVNPVHDDFPKIMFRVGKAKSGRLLDGREWNEVPEVRA